jgi:glycosyltransferase 2 family protein
MMGEPLLRSETLDENQDCSSSDLETISPAHRGGAREVAIFAAKLLVTAACFWYLSRQIDFSQVLPAIPMLDFRWVAFAILTAVLQIPLVGVRWYNVVQALTACNERMTQLAMIAIAAIGLFFAQVFPSVAGDGMRAWLLVRLGCDWRNAVLSVIIDRGVGVGLLIALGFVILLLPAGLTALGEYRDVVVIVYGALFLAGVLGLLLAPKIALLLARWRYVRWLATLATEARRVLFGRRAPMILTLGCLIHVLTVIVVWSLGRAQGLSFPIFDAAVLVTVMVGVTLVPISVGGWGLREIAVISLLSRYGVAPEKALLFSVCFGLAAALASLPGALTWLLYSSRPSRGSVDEGRPSNRDPADTTLLTNSTAPLQPEFRLQRSE